MSRIDAWFSELARNVARRTSRRSFLTRLGTLLVGGASLPLLPVARASDAPKLRAPGEPSPDTPTGDPDSCDYWRYCSIDGFLSSCCGGTHRSCPPGTEMSPVTWIGSCRNPADGKDYVISYNDCCGKDACGRCFCNRNQGDKPVYYPSKSNDIDWCMGRVGVIYNSTVAIVIGVATETE
ncbi:MAG: methylamine dehydrogenase (amicyanin) light chain [Deltaproteobacteria bacterium]|nr:MAG: methylamine dehydrogenase (amicyanin) light chain [Deltaproteobacteria bacterium]